MTITSFHQPPCLYSSKQLSSIPEINNKRELTTQTENSIRIEFPNTSPNEKAERKSPVESKKETCSPLNPKEPYVRIIHSRQLLIKELFLFLNNDFFFGICFKKKRKNFSQGSSVARCINQ
jgi:hypothetical protein